MLPFYLAACSSNEKSQFTTDGRVFGIHSRRWDVIDVYEVARYWSWVGYRLMDGYP
jgi:hypothetical protein